MSKNLMNLEKLSVDIVDLQKGKLLENGYKQVEKFEQYFVNEQADIIRLKDNGSITRVPISTNKQGRLKCNFINANGKQVTVIVHRIVYEAFRGPIVGELLFIDEDTSNCTLSNLITTKDLMDFYKSVNNIPVNKESISLEDAPEDVPEDAPASTTEDTTENSPEDTIEDKKSEEETDKAASTEAESKSEKTTTKTAKKRSTKKSAKTSAEEAVAVTEDDN